MASASWSVTGPSGVCSESRVRSAAPQPMSVRRPRARPGSASWAAGILPAASIPSSFIPVGHIFRGSTVVPGRASRSRAASAPAGATSASQRWPVQLSHRPHRAASGSSSSWRRNSIRHSAVAS